MRFMMPWGPGDRAELLPGSSHTTLPPAVTLELHLLAPPRGGWFSLSGLQLLSLKASTVLGECCCSGDSTFTSPRRQVRAQRALPSGWGAATRRARSWRPRSSGTRAAARAAPARERPSRATCRASEKDLGTEKLSGCTNFS